VPQALQRLQRLIRQGLASPASWWPLGRAAEAGGKRVAKILAHAPELDGNTRTRPLRALLGARAKPHTRRAPPRAALLAPFHKVTRSYWPGWFHWYPRSDVPRPNNDLEQCFGAHRAHARRATGRKGASPALGLRGAVRMAACAATRLRAFAGEALTPAHLPNWQALRQQRESRRQRRVPRSRFRRNPEA
jgi:hypothetical protein